MLVSTEILDIFVSLISFSIQFEFFKSYFLKRKKDFIPKQNEDKIHQRPRKQPNYILHQYGESTHLLGRIAHTHSSCAIVGKNLRETKANELTSKISKPQVGLRFYRIQNSKFRQNFLTDTIHDFINRVHVREPYGCVPGAPNVVA